MKARAVKWLAVGGCFLLSACAVITVNVYFPEKAAKEAYKSLDEMLLKKKQQKAPSEKAPSESPPVPDQKMPETKPQSTLHLPDFSLIAAAQAAENEAEVLAVELASRPEVLKAYDEMNQRLPRLTALYASGAVGLTNQGLVSIRDKAKVGSQDQAMVAAENQSRKTVVTSMAKAILKLNHQKETSPALAQVMGKAAATFAETRREEAQPGWWIQLPNGNWVQK